jgi:hypothetical protein
MGHLAVVEVFYGRADAGRAERAEHQSHVVLLDQPPGVLDRLGRAVAVIQRDEVDAALVDAAAVVEHLHVGGFGLADLGQGRRRPAVGHDVADLDFVVGGAGDRRKHQHRRRAQQRSAKHFSFPQWSRAAYLLLAIISSTSRSLSLPK